MPTPYRRSCQRCVTAKRRCDLGSPCSRCRIRSLQCQYDGQKTTAHPSNQRLATSQAPVSSDGDVASPSTLLEEETPDFSDLQLDWNEIMTGVDDFVVPGHLASVPNMASVIAPTKHMFQDRVNHTVKQLKTWPLVFATKSLTPFVNLRVYCGDIPVIIQEVLAICSLYAHRTSRTEEVVRTCVSQAVRRLLEELESSSFHTWSLVKRLSFGQALIFYRIIQLFDGDITMRAEAEASVPRFEFLFKELKTYFVPAHVEVVESGSSDSWSNWLLSESIRRTLVVGYSVEGAYTYLKHGLDDPAELDTLSFSLQKALWEADSAYHWQKAFEKSSSLPTNLVSWRAETALVSPTDLDELGMIMMVLVKGLDHCRNWVGDDEQMERFDLR